MTGMPGNRGGRASWRDASLLMRTVSVRVVDPGRAARPSVVGRRSRCALCRGRGRRAETRRGATRTGRKAADGDAGGEPLTARRGVSASASHPAPPGASVRLRLHPAPAGARAGGGVPAPRPVCAPGAAGGVSASASAPGAAGHGVEASGGQCVCVARRRRGRQCVCVCTRRRRGRQCVCVCTRRRGASVRLRLHPARVAADVAAGDTGRLVDVEARGTAVGAAEVPAVETVQRVAAEAPSRIGLRVTGGRVHRASPCAARGLVRRRVCGLATFEVDGVMCRGARRERCSTRRGHQRRLIGAHILGVFCENVNRHGRRSRVPFPADVACGTIRSVTVTIPGRVGRGGARARVA